MSRRKIIQPKKPSILLSMIVKNEEHCIEETLKSISKYIDYYVINDTGSTDNTISVIKNYFDKINIKGEIVEHEFRTCNCHDSEYKKYSFFHFGWNRSYALEKAVGKSDYIWVIDADDIIEGSLILPTVMDRDCYYLKYGKNYTYTRPQIFKNNAIFKWHYKEPLHEYLDSMISGYSTETIEGDYYINSQRLGDRNKDPQKYLKDAMLLEEYLKTYPKNERAMFYCAQSYLDHKDYVKAIKWYQTRIDNSSENSYQEEIFYSHYKIGQCKKHLQKPNNEVIKSFENAIKVVNDRAPEALVPILEIYLEEKKYREGYDLAKPYVNQNKPVRSSLFITVSAYQYGVKKLYAECAYHLGYYNEALSIINLVLKMENIPDYVRKSINHLQENCAKMVDRKNLPYLLFYAGELYVTKNTVAYHLLESLHYHYNIYLAGKYIDIRGLDNLEYLEPINVEEKVIYNIVEEKNIDTIILFEYLDFFRTNSKKILTKLKHVVHILSGLEFKLAGPDGIDIWLQNSAHINKYLNKITHLVYLGGENLSNQFSDLHQINKNCITKITEDKDYLSYNPLVDCLGKRNKYHSKRILEGVMVKYPPQLEKRLDIFGQKNMILFINNLVNQFNDLPEIKLELISHLVKTDLEKCKKIFKEIFAHYQSNCQMSSLIKSHYAKFLFDTQKYPEAYELCTDLINYSDIAINIKSNLKDISGKCAIYIKDQYLVYPYNIINKIGHVKLDNQPRVLFSITTCKRFDLFRQTINSFIHCCKDLDMISEWIVVDDNSASEEIQKMKLSYPFFHFIIKDINQKGHVRSMNIIRDYAISNGYQYLLHIEDDFHFVQKRSYIKDAIEILNHNEKLGQVLFNLNYVEVIDHQYSKIDGGISCKTSGKINYVVHQHYESGTPQYNEYVKTLSMNNTWWPHYSFRPSLLRVSMLNDIGEYPNSNHFELAYAKEYVKNGYQSSFFDDLTCIHIGKKTWEKTENAYSLNQVLQFGSKQSVNNIKLIDGEKIDKSIWKNIKSVLNKLSCQQSGTIYNCEKIPQNKNISVRDKKLFYGNDFNYSRTVLDKISYFVSLIENPAGDQIFVFNCGRIIFGEDFEKHFSNLLSSLENMEYDIICLDDKTNDKNNLINIKPESLIMEKTGGYIISKTGCQKIYDNLEKNKISTEKYLDNILDSLKIYAYHSDLYTIKEIEDVGLVKKEFKEIPGFKFYSQLDSYDNDVGRFTNMTMEEIAEVVKKHKYACFNTYGYVKHSVMPEMDFMYLPNSKVSDGLYVLENY